MFIEACGWTAGVLFAISAMPQAIKSIREKHAEGMSHLTIWIWWWGEILALIYTIAQPSLMLPLILNYIFNLFWVTIIIYYKYNYKKYTRRDYDTHIKDRR